MQSAAIVEYLSEKTETFCGINPTNRKDIREWIYWDCDVLIPPIFAFYSVRLGEKKLLPIEVKPAIAAYHRQRAEDALSIFDACLGSNSFLCGQNPTIADLLCHCDIAFAEICEFNITKKPNIADWSERFKSLQEYSEPFDLLAMKDAAIS